MKIEKPNCILFYGNNTHPASKYAGVFRIATELRNNGYIVSCIDLTAFKGLDSDLKKLLTNLVSEKTLWIGFSTTFLPTIFGLPILKQIESYDIRWKDKNISGGILEFKNLVLSINPKVKFITGGARYFPVEKYGFQVFKSYSDHLIVEYTKWCNKNSPYHSQFSNPVIVGSEYLDFPTSQIVYNDSDIILPRETLPIEISRGCIFKCKFCTYNLKGKKKGEWVKRSEILRDEFNRNYEKYGITDYVFADDTYNDSIDKVKLLHDDVFSKLNFKINFTTYLRLDLLMRFPESAAIIRDSGIKSAMFGIETISHANAKLIGKGVNPMEQFDYVRQLKENEFKSVLMQSGMISGLPYDTEESLMELEEFIFSDKNKLDYILVNPLGVHPVDTNKQVVEHSEFDLNYEKYGYEMIIDYNADFNNEIKWRNVNTGLTKDWCINFSNRVNNNVHTSDKFKYGAFLYAQYKSIGVTGDDLICYTIPEILKKYNIPELGRKRIQEYKFNIMKYYGL